MRECTWEEVCDKVSGVKITDDMLKCANVVLFGCRAHGRLVYDKLHNLYNIVAMSDNNPELWGGGGIAPGVDVIEPRKLTDIDNLIVLITVTGQHYNAIKTQLDGMGIENYLYSEYVIAKNFDKIREVYESLLDDEDSRRVYRNVLMSHLARDMEYVKAVYVRNQYFEPAEFMFFTGRDVFVDCGACAGDTVEQFVMNRVGQLKRIYAFEPFDRAYDAMQIRNSRVTAEWMLDEGSIVTVKSAVSDRDGVVEFAGNAACGHIVTGGGTDAVSVRTVSLDSYFADKEDKPTFIKADIEGSEAEMIRGAKGVIAQYKPLMAVCIYHRIEDLYEIPLMLKEMNPDYRMAVRHHTPGYCETVLYCY